MLLLDYEVKKTEICDCTMASIVNAATYYNRDYAYLFQGIWVFDFKEKGQEDTCFWERLMTPEQIDSSESLYQHHGISMTLVKDGFLKFLEDVETDLEHGDPICLEFDAFYCPWSGVYQKHYLNHFCLVVGYDKEKRELICSDPYMNKTLERYSLEELEKGFIKYFRFSKKELSDNRFQNWEEDVRVGAASKFEKQDGRDTFDKMRLFADEIHDPENFIVEMKKQNDTYSYELFYQMKYISHSRSNYAEFLRYLAEHAGARELVPCAEALETAAGIWRLVWLKFTKVAYMEKKEKIQAMMDSIFEKIHKAIELEQTAAEELMRITE